MREVARDHGRRRNLRQIDWPRPYLRSLIAKKEERPIFDNRATNRSAKLVLPEYRDFLVSLLREEVLVAQLAGHDETRMRCRGIRSIRIWSLRLRWRPAPAAELRRSDVGLNLELLNSVDGRLHAIRL